MEKTRMKKEHGILLIGCIVAIVFRFWLLAINPQPFAFDQYEYYKFAIKILDHGIFADSARLYGYPLFQAILYKIFSPYSIQPVIVFQAVMDSLTALLIYQWARLLFHKKNIPWLAFVLYIFNPYTSAYVGVLLSEVSGIFITALLLYLFTLFWLKKKYWVFLAFCFIAGFLPQIRPAFLYFSAGLFILGLYRYWKKTGMIIGILLFILPFLYVLWGNVVYFNEWKFTNVDHIAERELFISVMVPNRAPYHMNGGYDVYPEEVMKLYEEYSKLPQNKTERASMGAAYLAKAIEIIKKDPWLFFRQRLGKMFFVWEKHFLFYYQESPNTMRDMLVYWVNIALLLCGLSGLVLWLIKKRTVLAAIYLSFIAYISVIHSISFAEERYSLPGYPLLFLFAGYALDQLYKRSFITPNKE
ncbi:MAG: hypothetical protein ACD_48C00106G0003 [uncultured bacterium]|nr:MAG: hypothetical protein ACD_48C00106G0003 [uncultured bacterium]